MTLNHDSPEINPDHITDYIYANAVINAAGLIDIQALLAQLREDYGEVDYFSPDNNPNSAFCIAVFQRASKHNAARMEQVIDEADPVFPSNDNEPVDLPQGWLLSVTCLVALLIPFATMSGLFVVIAVLVG